MNQPCSATSHNTGGVAPAACVPEKQIKKSGTKWEDSIKAKKRTTYKFIKRGRTGNDIINFALSRADRSWGLCSARSQKWVFSYTQPVMLETQGSARPRD
jgi:hypothetical protein